MIPPVSTHHVHIRMDDSPKTNILKTKNVATADVVLPRNGPSAAGSPGFNQRECV